MKKLLLAFFLLGPAICVSAQNDGRGTDPYNSSGLATDSANAQDDAAVQANSSTENSSILPSGNPDIGAELREDSMKYAIELANNKAATAEAEAANSIEKSKLVEDNSKLTIEIAVGLIIATILVAGAYLLGRRSKSQI